MIDKLKKKRTAAIRNKKATPAKVTRKKSTLSKATPKKSTLVKVTPKMAKKVLAANKARIMATPGRSSGRRPGRPCCQAFVQIRNFYVQAAALGFTQISFDVRQQGGTLTVFVDSIDWFNERDCSILLNVNSPVLGLPDAVINCRILNAIFADNLQTSV